MKIILGRNHLFRMKPMIALATIISMFVVPLAAQRAANKTSEATPESVGMSAERLARIDEAVLASIERKETPGAVVLVGRKERIVYRKAVGDRAITPKREPMTTETIFDLASLTKIVATATSIMILVERGKVRLNDPLSNYIPEIKGEGRERITIE